MCLLSDALLQHPPSYLGCSYLGRGVSLHGCSSKAQPLLLTLEEGYLLTAALPDLQRGIAPLGPPVPTKPLLLRRGVGPPGLRPWPCSRGISSRCCLIYHSSLGFPDSSVGKESAYNAGDPSLIPRPGRSPGEVIGYPFQYSWASLVAQLVKNPPAMRETWVLSLGWEDPLEKGRATHSSILAWRYTYIVHGVAKSRI